MQVACPSHDSRARSYRIVVRGSACDAASYTSRSGTPASSAAVMKAWRSVWANELGDACTPRDASDNPAGAVAFEAVAVEAEQDRPLAALADCKVDSACRPWCERGGDNLAALAHEGEGSMSAFEAQRLDVGAGRL